MINSLLSKEKKSNKPGNVVVTQTNKYVSQQKYIYVKKRKKRVFLFFANSMMPQSL